MAEPAERIRETDERLPRELVWLYPAFFAASIAIISPNAFSASWSHAAARGLFFALPWLSISAITHGLYRGAAQRLVRPARAGIARWIAHAALVATVATVVAIALHPVHRWLGLRVFSLSVYIAQCVAIAWAVVLPSLAIEALRRRSRRAEQQLAEARNATLQAQLSALQAQTNPHFLFNSINTVATLIPEDPALAERTLEQLADLFRYALEGSKLARVELSRELDFVEDFLALQRVRFGARLDATVERAPDVERCSVIPLVLQPLVENAVLHSLADRKRAVVRVCVARDEKAIRVTVDDDGPGPERSAHRGTSSSLDNLRARLRAWSERASLATGPSPLGGFRAELTLPIEAP